MRRLSLSDLLLLSVFTFSACGDLAFWEQEDSKTDEAAQGIPLADMMVDENGDILAVMGDGEQMIEAASDGELAGTSIVFAAGALAIGTEVQVAVGSSLATATTQSELGMTGSMEQVSATVNIMANEDVVLQAPLTVAISISSAALNLADEMQYAILCKMRKPGTEGYSLEVWNDAKITFKGDKVEFQTMFFGSYQVIKIPKNITVPEPVVVTAPILNKAVESALEPLTIVATATKSNSSSATIQYTLKGQGSIEKCMLFPDADGKLPFELKGIDLGTKTSFPYVAKKKEALFFAIGCRDKNGRELPLAWTTKVSLEAEQPMPSPKTSLICDDVVEDPYIAECFTNPSNPFEWKIDTSNNYYLKFPVVLMGLQDGYTFRFFDLAANQTCAQAAPDPTPYIENEPLYLFEFVSQDYSDLASGPVTKRVCVEAWNSTNVKFISEVISVTVEYKP